MKRKRIGCGHSHSLAFLLILAASFFGSQVPFLYADEEPLLLIGLQNNPPLSYETGGEIRGILYDLTKELVKRMGVEARYELLPINRIIQYLKAGKADGVFFIVYSKDRESFLSYSSVPLFTSTMPVFTRKGEEFDFTGITDLRGKRVGKVSGYFISEEFLAAAENGLFTLDEASEIEFNLRKLALGRIDCFVSGLQTTKFAIRQLGLDDRISMLPIPIASGAKVYFALSRTGTRIPDKAAFIERVDRIIGNMYMNGTAMRIEESYLD